jgi:hypothetical protein
MLKKILITLLIILNIVIIYYLYLPLPAISDLPNSAKSDLPGDTVQIPNVSAYFTNLSRDQIISFYRSQFTSPFTIEINHPPEKSKQIILDTTQSYYFYEFYIPFKGSLYVNGYEWENDVFTKPEKRAVNKLIFKDILYPTKVTIRTFPTSPYTRIFIFLVLEIFLATAYFLYQSLLHHDKN